MMVVKKEKRGESMSEEEPREVGKILPRSRATSRSLTASEMKSRVKVAMTTSGTQMGSGGNFYSPELSTDFLSYLKSGRAKKLFQILLPN